jgi:hypothetical protein
MMMQTESRSMHRPILDGIEHIVSTVLNRRVDEKKRKHVQEKFMADDAVVYYSNYGKCYRAVIVPVETIGFIPEPQKGTIPDFKVDGVEAIFLCEKARIDAEKSLAIQKKQPSKYMTPASQLKNSALKQCIIYAKTHEIAKKNVYHDFFKQPIIKAPVLNTSSPIETTYKVSVEIKNDDINYRYIFRASGPNITVGDTFESDDENTFVTCVSAVNEKEAKIKSIKNVQEFLKREDVVVDSRFKAMKVIEKYMNGKKDPAENLVERMYKVWGTVTEKTISCNSIYKVPYAPDELEGKVEVERSSSSNNVHQKTLMTWVVATDQDDAELKAIENFNKYIGKEMPSKDNKPATASTGKESIESVEIIDDDEIDTGKKNDSKPTKEKKEENWINCTCAGCSHIKMLNAIKQFKCKAKVFKKGKKIEYAKMPIFCDKFGPKKSTVNG